MRRLCKTTMKAILSAAKPLFEMNNSISRASVIDMQQLWSLLKTRKEKILNYEIDIAQVVLTPTFTPFF